MDNTDPPRSKNTDTNNKNKNGTNRKEYLKKRAQKRWIITAFAVSFCITAVLSLGSDTVVSSNVFIAILLLLFFIFTGILFDVIGLAVAIADIKPFNSMASRRMETGKKAVWLISNAEKVGSFCNDLIGDISGVMSGAAGAAIAVKFFSDRIGGVWLTLAMTSLISALIVGFKAIGKLIAVKHSEKIVLYTAKVMCGFKK